MNTLYNEQKQVVIVYELVKALLNPSVSELLDGHVMCAQVGGRGIQASWAGGVRGREVMDRVFPMIPQLLSDHGLFYLLTVSENDPGVRFTQLQL